MGRAGTWWPARYRWSSRDDSARQRWSRTPLPNAVELVALRTAEADLDINDSLGGYRKLHHDRDFYLLPGRRAAHCLSTHPTSPQALPMGHPTDNPTAEVIPIAKRSYRDTLVVRVPTGASAQSCPFTGYWPVTLDDQRFRDPCAADGRPSSQVRPTREWTRAVVDPGSREAHPVEARRARFRCWSEQLYGPRHDREVAMRDREPTMRSRELGEGLRRAMEATGLTGVHR